MRKVKPVAFHRLTASLRTCSLMYGLTASSVTTSTSRPNNSSRSCLIAMRSRRLRPGSSFTKRSISLFKPPSPRDIETKNPHILGAVSGGDSQYFVTLVLQHFVRVHGRLFLGVDFMLQGVSWQGRNPS